MSHDEEGNTKAITRAAAIRLATPPDGVERSLWLYELCRLLIARVNVLIVGFFNDNPKCSAVNCPEMRASEWQYLCAVHDPPKSCCAIDYCCHTLDWATNIITNQKHFPSRLTLGGDGGGGQQGLRQLTNIFRRVYRMFAHAWFQHRDVFWQVENTEGLYVLYKTVCEVYSLMPADTYTVPPEAEGTSTAEDSPAQEEFAAQQDLQGHSLPLRPKPAREGTVINVKDGPPAAATTKRHKHTPSTGSFVPPITEDDEDTENSTGDDDHPDDASVLSTVRYDPKDLQPTAPLDDTEDKQDPDVAKEVKALFKAPQIDGEGGETKGKSVSAEEGKSPITPIDDESSPDEQGLSDAHVQEEPSVTKTGAEAVDKSAAKGEQSEEVIEE